MCFDEALFSFKPGLILKWSCFNPVQCGLCVEVLSDVPVFCEIVCNPQKVALIWSSWEQSVALDVAKVVMPAVMSGDTCECQSPRRLQRR